MIEIFDLEKPLSHLVAIAVTATLGNDRELSRLLGAALEVPVALTAIDEVILQTALFAGIPRALNALQLLNEILDGQPEDFRHQLLQSARAARADAVEDPAREGSTTFEHVYGTAAGDLRRKLARQHPAFEAWLLKSAYGEILSRPGLDLKTRELIAVAELSTLELPIPLWGHLKGALRNGASHGELRAVLSLITQYGVDISAPLTMLHQLEQKG